MASIGGQNGGVTTESIQEALKDLITGWNESVQKKGLSTLRVEIPVYQTPIHALRLIDRSVQPFHISDDDDTDTSEDSDTSDNESQFSEDFASETDDDDEIDASQQKGDVIERSTHFVIKINENLQRTLRHTKKEIEKTKEKMSILSTRMREKVGENKKMKSKIHYWQGEISRRKQEYEQLIYKLSDDIKESEKGNGIMRESMKQLTEANMEQETKIQNLQEELQSRNQQIDGLAEQVRQSMENDLQDAERIRRLTEALTDQISTSGDSSSALQLLQSQFEEEKERHRETEEKYNEELSEKETSKREVESRLNEARIEIETMRKTNAELIQLKNDWQIEKDKLKNEAGEFVAQITDLNDEISAAATRFQNLSEEVQDSKTATSKLEQKVKESQDQLIQSNNELSKKEKEVASLQGNLMAQSANIQKYENDVQRLTQASLSDATVQSELTSQISEKNQEITTLEEDLLTRETQISKLEGQIQDLLHIKVTAEETELLKSEISQLKEALNDRTSFLISGDDEKEKKIEELLILNQTLTNQLSTNQSQVKTIERDKITFEAQLQQMKEDFEAQAKRQLEKEADSQAKVKIAEQREQLAQQLLKSHEEQQTRKLQTLSENMNVMEADIKAKEANIQMIQEELKIKAFENSQKDQDYQDLITKQKQWTEEINTFVGVLQAKHAQAIETLSAQLFSQKEEGDNEITLLKAQFVEKQRELGLMHEQMKLIAGFGVHKDNAEKLKLRKEIADFKEENSKLKDENEKLNVSLRASTLSLGPVQNGSTRDLESELRTAIANKDELALKNATLNQQTIKQQSTIQRNESRQQDLLRRVRDAEEKAKDAESRAQVRATTETKLLKQIRILEDWKQKGSILSSP